MQLDDRGYRRYWDEERETMDPREREKLILERIKHQLRYVYEQLPFYRRHWDAAGFEPAHVETLDDINRIPIYDIDDIRASIAAHPPYGDYQGVSVKDAKQAPLRLFAFYDGFPPDVCVWSSDLVFDAPIALGWRFAEKLGAARS